MKPQTDTSDDGNVIGRAFRWSLAIIVVAAAAVGLGVYLSTERAVDAPPAPARVAETPVSTPAPAAVEAPAVTFTDITASAGIDFVHTNGAYGEKLLPETMGGGVAFFDYDNDADPDLLLVNSDYWPDRQPAAGTRPTLALYRNDGAGGFSNVTAEAGLDVSLYGMGVATGDYDNDGDIDLLVTALGPNRLFRNDDGRFSEVSAAAGVTGADDAWSTSAAFFDYDNDGDLDLFVANYVRWSKEIDLNIGFQLTGIGRAYGPPTTFEGTYPYLYRNEGDGTFTDVSAASGVQVNNPATGAPMAKSLGVSPIDIDGDGFVDVFVGNDTVQNFFFRNGGDGTFEEVGTMLGLAFDRNGAATGAMGSDVAHYRNGQDLGLAVGNFANEMTSLYVSQGDMGLFADEAISDGLGAATRQALTFGLFFFDYDLDGRVDLFQANGHLEEAINLVQSSQHYAQPPQLFWNCGEACAAGFSQVSAGDLDKPLVGRGATFADIDGDGDLDVVVTQVGRPPRLLRNDQALGHHWLRVRLTGSGPVNRDAIGAWVEVEANGITQRRQVMPARSYLSQTEPVLTFGLGKATQVGAIRIRWPNGVRQSVEPTGSDRVMVVEYSSQ